MIERLKSVKTFYSEKKKLGSRKIIALCTHALMVNNAAESIKDAGVDAVISTNTIPNDVSKVDVTEILVDHYKSLQ